MISSHKSTFVLQNHLPYSNIIPRTVTPISTPFRQTKGWFTIVGNPENTIPLIPPIFKCNSGDKELKRKEMPCLEHIVYSPNKSIKTLSNFNNEESKNGMISETLNTSQMHTNMDAPWPRMQPPQVRKLYHD